MCFFINEEGAFDPAECFKFAHLHIMKSLLFEDAYDVDDPITHKIYDCLENRKDARNAQIYNYFPILKTIYKQKISQLEERNALLTRYHQILLNQHKDTYNPTELRDLVDQLLIFIETGNDRELFDSDDMDSFILELAGCGFSSVPALLTCLMGYMAVFPDIQTKIIAFVGYNIPKNTVKPFSVWSLHHDKKLWKNPTNFDPCRFLDSCGRLTIPEHFIPFGLGERRCPGEALVDMEVYLFFTHIMHQLNVLAEGTILNLESDYRLAIQPKPFKIRISSREDWSICHRQ
ncbi:cytochrome P450 1A4 [Magallana gigas]|uniref:cytochrome P450 1A4 n=1 Tax=Magallana gigas TaxID=29159 RepID=UPI00333F363A